MIKPKLFQYVILWHPSEKQSKEEGLKSKILVEITTVLGVDQATASMEAAMAIPSDKKLELDQIEVVIRPF